MNRAANLNSIRKIQVAVVCLCATVFLHTLAFAADPSANARKIMDDVYGQDTSHDITMSANFQIHDAQGHTTKKDFTYRRLGSPGASKTLVVFTSPTEIRGVALLSINQRGVSDRQYMYIPATQRVRSVASQERSARFIGTDFTFEDIGERILDDFTYRLLSDTETMEGHPTYKVEARPVDASRSQYKYIYYWVAQDAPVILHAEMYDAQGHEVRVLHASQLKRVNGIWGARHTEMTTVQGGTKTVLSINEVKFNSNLDEKLFTPQGFAAALAPPSGK